MAVRSTALLARLERLHPAAIDLSLDRIQRLLAALGSPERHLPPAIHVAGTNGKGSTLAALRAMLEAAGYKVHAYTSPHLMRFHERIRLAGRVIREAALAELLAEVEAANAGAPLTFFEATTAAALLAFSRHDADLLLLETGLGGRLDATNVIERPLATVLTPIAIDHVEYLGPSLAAIAAEKAGILKPGVPAIVAPQTREALEVIEARAAAIGAPLHRAGVEWRIDVPFGLVDAAGRLDLPPPSLAGPHQLINAATAVATLRALPALKVGAEAIAQGLRSIDWPARLQPIRSGPLRAPLSPFTELWLDGGHNPAAGEALAATLAAMQARDPRRMTLILAMLAHKDAEGFLSPFAPLWPEVITLPLPGAKAQGYRPGALAKIARGFGLRATHEADLASALRLAGQGCRTGRVLVTGSLYLAGDFLDANRRR